MCINTLCICIHVCNPLNRKNNVYVIAQKGVKFGINIMSCSENGNEMHEA